jgi:ornithine carbamoyltransferase
MMSEISSLRGRDLLSVADLSAPELSRLVERAFSAKHAATGAAALAGVPVALLFEKPSLRTRASFEFGLGRLGARPVYFDLSGDRIGARESVKDYAMNLERWCSAIVARVYRHGVLEEMAAHAGIPVINALSDREHPCQALADMLTLREAMGTLAGVRIAYIGDGNNVCRSLMLAAAGLGVRITVVTPEGHGPGEDAERRAAALAARSGGSVACWNDPAAVRGHHAVYTDTWVSMGDDPAKARAFGRYRVDEAMMALASDGVAGGSWFMHCLPAARGSEVEAAVIDGTRSLVYEQAENRMHAQNALMIELLGRGM